MSKTLNVTTVPAFQDNYLWLIHDNKYATVIDPGDANKILDSLRSLNLELTSILLTHHHADHIGGVKTLISLKQIPVYGPAKEIISGVTRKMYENDVIRLTKPNIEFKVFEVPGHTKGHVAYYSSKYKWLFCGDTLFAGGCGRLFEGTSEEMINSLTKLALLPEDTKIFCAHEYTISNLQFAMEAEPDNNIIQERLLQEEAKISKGIPTIPSTIVLEKKTNPFLRFKEKNIQENLISSGKINFKNSVDAFTALREWKNNF